MLQRKISIPACLSLLGLMIFAITAMADVQTIKVSVQPLHAERISPHFYGSFIELWDDHVPGMWAQMLNDRGFEGVIKRGDWCYYLGEPNFCDREWDKNVTWSRDTKNSFNSTNSAKLTAPASLSQQNLSVKKGMTYRFSGYFRTDNPDLRAKVLLKTLLPDHSWMILACADISNPRADWKKFDCEMVSTGTTDNAVFYIQATGSGNLWIDKISLMPADNIKGWRKDVVEAIRELGSPVIRWGGCVVDPGHYKWKECVGDRDLRIPFENWVWGRIDPNDVGIDEFLQFCEIVGAEPLVCISFADGAQNAGDLVHYCNDSVDTKWGKKRAENGHPKPYGVKYWQIGNELDDEDYAAGFLSIAEAIKKADSDAAIFASFPTQLLLEKAGKYIDYVCPHYYRDDFDNIEREIRETADITKKIVPDHTIKIGVTEWNFTNPWGLARASLLAVDSVVKTGQFLNLFHRNSDVVQLTCRSNMCNSLGDGVIQTKPSGLLKPPAYYVMKLYTEYSKPVPVVISGVPEGLDVSACKSEDGKSLTLFIVNKREEPVELSLDLSNYGAGFAPAKGEVVCDTADQRQTDAQNHWTAPNRIKTIDLNVSHPTIILPAFSTAAIECK